MPSILVPGFFACFKDTNLCSTCFQDSDLAGIFAGVIGNPSLHYQELFQATAALLIRQEPSPDRCLCGPAHCDPAEADRDKWRLLLVRREPRGVPAAYVRYRAELWVFYLRRGAERA